MAMRWSRQFTQLGLALLLGLSKAHAVGLGPIKVHSALGEPLRAEIALEGRDAAEVESRCLKSRLETFDGVPVAASFADIVRMGDKTSIRLGSQQSIGEPAFKILLRVACHGAGVHREYQVLLDFEPLRSPAPVAAPHPPGQARPAFEKRALPAPATDLPPVAVAPATVSVTEAAGTRADGRDQGAGKQRVRQRKAAPAAKANVLRMSPMQVIPMDEHAGLRLRLSSSLALADLAVLTPAPREGVRNNSPSQPGPAANTQPAAAQALAPGSAQADTKAAPVRDARPATAVPPEHAAIEALREESLLWLRSLGVLLLTSLGAIIWLLWRIKNMHAAAHASAPLWQHRYDDELLPDEDAENHADPARMRLSPEPPSPLPRHAGRHEEGDLFDDSQWAATEGAGAAQTPVAQARPGTMDVRAVCPAALASGTARNDEHGPKAEEIADVMELVETWMALNDPAKVFELLKPFNNTRQPESPLPWLCLLDVYRSLGGQEKYEAIRQRINTTFNVKLAPWEATPESGPPRTLGNFPHVVATILSLWKSDELIPYLESLLWDRRNGERAGFELPIYRDLLRLLELAKDPARLTEEDGEISARAIEILSVAPMQAATEAPTAPAAQKTIPAETHALEAPVATPDPAPVPRIRERPRYITPSYERLIARQPAAATEAGTDGSLAISCDTRIETDVSDVVTEPASMPATDAISSLPAPEPVEAVEAPWPGAIDCAPAMQTAAPAVSTADRCDMSPMSIKLHLAIAYVDIGDKEGALLLLQEVMAEGPPELVQQASELAARLGGAAGGPSEAMAQYDQVAG